MDEQEDVESINKRLYNMEVPNEPIKKIMFYFTVLHGVIDYRFPENFINFDNPYFKTYNEMEQFCAIAQSFNPELLHTNNVIIYYNKKEFYEYHQIKDDDNGSPYEFKVIDPKDAADPQFHKNYVNNFNIPNINYHEKEFDIEIPKKVTFPHSEESDDSAEDYYYTEGLEANYLSQSNNHYEYNDNKKNKQYQNYRKKYNGEIMNHDKSTLKSCFYPNQELETISANPEEEEMTEQVDDDETEGVVEKVNIVNKLVVTHDWVDYIYNQPMKQLLKNLKTAVKEEDVIRVKTISLPKNVFFYLSILLLLLILACAITLIDYCAKLNVNHKFLDLNKDEVSIEGNRDSVIVPCKKCYHRVRTGNNLGISAGCFDIFFVFFIFILWIVLQCGPCKKNKKKNGKKKNVKTQKVGLNMVHILVFAVITLISFIISVIAEIFIIIGIATHCYKFVHDSSRTQLICNSIIIVSYILVIMFYFKQ